MKKIISMLLCVIITLSVVCTSVFATEKSEETSEGYKKYLSNSSDYLNASGQKVKSDFAPDVYSKAMIQYILGDVTVDNRLNTGDATLLLRYCTDLTDFTGISLILADANQNGKVNTGDATLVLRTVVGLEQINYIEIDDTVSYNITYDDGIDGIAVEMPAAAECREGDFYYIDRYLPTCADRTFIGWLSSYDNAVYVSGDSFAMPSQDVVLTAQWKEDVGHILTVQVYDIFNETISYSFEITLRESVSYNQSNFPFPDGYGMYGSQTFNINYTESGISPSAITVESYIYLMDAGIERTVIYTPAGVNNIRLDLDRDYILKCDVDMAEFGIFEPIGWATEADVEDAIFTGSIEGNDCGILNLCCDYWDTTQFMCTNVGFISRNAGSIRNLTVITALPTETSDSYGVFGYYNVGIIAGRNEQGGKIEYCFAQGNFGTSDLENTARGAAGGLVGSNNGLVSCCGANCAGEGYFYLGGLAGKNFGTIDQSWSAGAINHGMDDATLEYYEVWCIGGLVGGSGGTISNSYSILIGNIMGYMVVGGLIGWVEGGNVNRSYVAYIDYIYSVLPEYSGPIAGYVKTMPSESYLYYTEGTDALPEGFSSSIWDLNGLCFADLPDLINFRRPPEGEQ